MAIAATICFDILDPSISRHLVLAEGELIVNQANFAWFGEGGASGSVLQLLRFRGIESRVPTVLVSNSGESVIMDRIGHYKTETTKMFTNRQLSYKLKLTETFSLYRVWGDWFVWVMGISVFIA